MQVLARVLAVAEVAGRGDREDRHRAGDEVGSIAPEELHHLDHPRDAVLGERARHDRLASSWSGSCTGARRPRPGPRCRRSSRTPWRGTGCGRGRRRGGRTRRSRSSSARRVSPVRWSRTLRPRRAGHEVDPVAAEVGVRFAVAVVEHERRRRRRRSRASTTSRGNRTRSPVAFVRQPVLEQAPPHLRPRISMPTSARTRFASSTIRRDELVVQDVQGRPHRALLGSGRDGRCPPAYPPHGDAERGPCSHGVPMAGWSGIGIPIASRRSA